MWWNTCHTQVKGQAHWRGAWASQRAGPPGTKGLGEERSEVFMFYLDYLVVGVRKGKARLVRSTMWQHTIMIVVAFARSDMISCHLDGWWLYVTHTSSVIICCSLTRSVRFYQTKPTAELLCSRTMPTHNAPPQRTNEHRNTVVEKRIPHHCAKVASWVKNELHYNWRAPPELKVIRNIEEQAPPDWETNVWNELRVSGR